MGFARGVRACRFFFFQRKKAPKTAGIKREFRGHIAFPSGFMFSVQHGVVSFRTVSQFSFCAKKPLHPRPIKFADLRTKGAAGLHFNHFLRYALPLGGANVKSVIGDHCIDLPTFQVHSPLSPSLNTDTPD